MVEHPLDISRNGNYQHIPWITGVVEHEGAVRAACEFWSYWKGVNVLIAQLLAILTNLTLLDDLNAKLDELLTFIMDLDVRDENNVEEIVQEIKDKYFNGGTIDTAEDEQRLVDVN